MIFKILFHESGGRREGGEKKYPTNPTALVKRLSATNVIL